MAGRWNGVVLLLNGASCMGKSYFAMTLLGPEYGAHLLRIDQIYTKAVTDAKMLNSAKFKDKKDQQREARRLARDRKWPSPATKDVFFKSYERHVRGVFERARKEKAPVVLEGGSLRKDDEIAIVMRCADEIFGSNWRLARVTIQVPYERWLQNRISRLAKSGVAAAPVRQLTNRHYLTEIESAVPSRHARVADYVVQSPDDLRELMEKLSQSEASRPGRAAAADIKTSL